MRDSCIEFKTKDDKIVKISNNENSPLHINNLLTDYDQYRIDNADMSKINKFKDD